MKKIYRIKNNWQYKYVYKKGSVITNKTFTLVFVKNNLPQPMFGFNINTKYGKAVKRNKLRRQLKEICESLVKEVCGGYYIIKPRFFHENAPLYSQMKTEIFELIKRTQTGENRQ